MKENENKSCASVENAYELNIIKVYGKIKYLAREHPWKGYVGAEIYVRNDTPEFLEHIKIGTSEDQKKYGFGWHREQNDIFHHEQEFSNYFATFEEAKAWVEAQVKYIRTDIINQLNKLKEMKEKEMTIEKIIDPANYL